MNFSRFWRNSIALARQSGWRFLLWAAAGTLTALLLGGSGWLGAVYRAGFAAMLYVALASFLLIACAAVLLPVAAALLRSLISGDPYWIVPRAFDAGDDPSKWRALARRLDLRETDAEASLWQDRESGQLWASRRFETGDGEFRRFKPLAHRRDWTGMADEDWADKDWPPDAGV